MGQAQGSNSRCAILTETTWGTVASANATTRKALVIPFVTEGMAYSRGLVEDPTITSARDFLKSGRGEVDSAGDVNVRMNYNAHGELLRHALGGYTVFEVHEITVGVGEAATFTAGLAVSGAGTSAGATGIIRSIDTANAKLYVVVTAGTFADLGTLTDTSTGSGTQTGASVQVAYAHRYRIGDPSDMIGFTFEKMFKFSTTSYAFHQYPGCRVNQWSLNMASSGLVEATFGLIGKTEVNPVPTGTTAYDASSLANGASANIDDLDHVAFDNFDIQILTEAGSSAVGMATELTFQLSNNLDGGVRAIGGQGARADLPVGKAKVSGNFGARFSDLTMYNKALDHTDSSLRCILDKSGSAWGGYGQSGGEVMDIYLPNLVFTPQAPAVDGPQGITISLDYEAFYTPGQAETTMEVWLLNQIADYSAVYGGAE